MDSRTTSPPNDFAALVEDWKQKALEAARLEREAKRAFAEGYLNSEGKNDGARTAEAEVSSSDVQLSADYARVATKAAEFLLRFTLYGKDETLNFDPCN